MNKTPHTLFLMILGFFMVEPSNAIANAFSPQNDSGDTISKSKNDEFDGWTEEQYKHYEDSIIFKLYSPVIACKSEAPRQLPLHATMRSCMAICPCRILMYPILLILTSQKRSGRFLSIQEYYLPGQKHTRFQSLYTLE